MRLTESAYQKLLKSNTDKRQSVATKEAVSPSMDKSILRVNKQSARALLLDRKAKVTIRR
jgi:hypothetical protein